MKFDAVFFDLDGTVIDSLQDITDAVNHTMRLFGLPEHTPQALRPELGWGAGHLIYEILPEGWKARSGEVLAEYLPYYALHTADKSCPYPGVPEMLQSLKNAGLGLAIVSNKPDAAVLPLHDRYFSWLLAFSMGEQPDLPRKPAPEMLHAAAARLGVELSRCLYVGDSEVDLQTARNAGIPCLCVSWGFRTRAALAAAGAEHIVDTPQELVDFVLSEQ